MSQMKKTARNWMQKNLPWLEQFMTYMKPHKKMVRFLFNNKLFYEFHRVSSSSLKFQVIPSIKYLKSLSNYTKLLLENNCLNF